MSIDRFRSDWLGGRGLDSGLAGVPGLSVVPEASRAENRVASLYVVGARQVVLCAPADAALIETFATWTGPTEVPERFAHESEYIGDTSAAVVLRTWVAWGHSLGAEYLGSGVNRVREVDPEPTDRPPAYPVVAADRDDPNDFAKIAALVDQCSEDDVDDAEIDLDELDSLIYCAEVDGAFVAYASARPFEMAPRWWDIGVLTHADHRRKGLSVACTRRVIDGVRAAGDEPLYRHNVQNESSGAVATALGFEPAMTLAAMKLSPEE